MHATLPLLKQSDFPLLRRKNLDILQVNLGYRCNQQCLHCHVNAAPNRTENMDAQTVDEVIEFMLRAEVSVLDLTGGAPELNPHFRRLVTTARDNNINVIDRCNLTILFEPGQEDLAEFLALQGVEVVASLPCYSQANVDQQRGKGVFDHSIEGLQKLNQLGYGQTDSELILNLVYNPLGASLPPSQQELELDYKKELYENFSIVFNQLFTITNMPIKRFGSTLISKGTFESYMNLLKESFDQVNLQNVMCKSQISVDWQGYIYDCDFNQQLELPALIAQRAKTHVRDLQLLELQDSTIAVADHCYACTAGQGSSCGGALA
ncbi:MAG: arsenosugar biosynthesis radical SAM protein ArsS [Gammaproteobacteria bacterium]|nr:arsenosugar biosynthesis radical SAM protein ArsS [Gammaproteobacteria bacterium]MDH5730573.1 arsenosugar biosynthesis radical SAM protein ArsS [Gammaproteobacteria bacterium]